MPELSLQTHKFDKMTKRCIETNPYRLHCIQGRKLFEYPVNSGNLWFEDLKEPAGRLIKKGTPVDMSFVDLKAPHVAYVAPITAGEEVIKQLEELNAQNETLKRELEAMNRERQARELQARVDATGKADSVTRVRNPSTNHSV